MKNPEENPQEFMPEDHDRNASLNPDPKRDMHDNNWDETAHMSRNMEKNAIQNERRNLNPDREKRQNSGLNPDRNGGDR